jgi:hypothetical protein
MRPHVWDPHRRRTQRVSGVEPLKTADRLGQSFLAGGHEVSRIPLALVFYHSRPRKYNLRQLLCAGVAYRENIARDGRDFRLDPTLIELQVAALESERPHPAQIRHAISNQVYRGRHWVRRFFGVPLRA